MTIAYDLAYDIDIDDRTAALSATAPSITWSPVCRVDELEPMWAEAALVHGRQIAIVRLPDDRLFAFSNIDPTTGSSVMARGIVGSRAGMPTIASPLHKEVYGLETGECYTDPTRRLPIWRARSDDGVVSVSDALVSSTTEQPAFDLLGSHR